jgi:hypothetical protein
MPTNSQMIALTNAGYTSRRQGLIFRVTNKVTGFNSLLTMDEVKQLADKLNQSIL